MTVERFQRTCPICEACCGLVIEADRDSGRVLSVKGDKDDPFSRGFVCPKSQALNGVADDADRLRRPLRKVGNGFVEIDWEEAFDLVAERLTDIRARHGSDAVGVYTGNPAANNPGLMIYSGMLIEALGTRQIYTAGSIDAMPRFLSSAALFGDKAMIPLPDIERTDLLVIVGANPMVSNGSLLTAPGMPHRLKALKARGGRMVVLDPRRTETAEIADRHVAVRPSSDAALLLAMVHELFEQSLVTPGKAGGLLRNLDRLHTLVSDFTPEKVEAVTGVPAAEIKALAREIAAAPSAAVYGRIGACCQAFGTLTSWAIDLLNILTGNLDREGGILFGRPVPMNFFSRDPYVGDQAPFARHHSRVSGFPEIARQFPVVALAEEIEETGDGKIHAMVTIAGNPLLSLPDSGRLEQAFRSLDFMVAIDLYLNETTRLADVILPPIDHLHRSGFTFHFSNNMIRSYAKAFPKVLERPAGGLDDWEIIVRIAARLAGADRAAHERAFLDRLHQRIIDSSPKGDGRRIADVEGALSGANGVERTYDLLVRLGEFGDGCRDGAEGLSLDALLARPEGVDMGPLIGGRLESLIRTPDGMIDLAPQVIVDDLMRLRSWMAADRGTGAGFILASRRDLRSMNSWLHNVAALAKGRDRCVLLVNPDDAARLGIMEGQSVRICANGESIVAPVQLSEQMQPGMVNLPHGWGHAAEGSRLSRAREKPGANFNRLLASTSYDVPSGNAAFNAVPVTLTPVTQAPG